MRALARLGFASGKTLLMGDDSSAIALHRIIPIAGRQPEAPAPAPTNDLERTATPPRARTARRAVQMTTSNVDVIRLWQLPDDFFALDLDAQWRAIAAVTSPAQRLNAPRRPCPRSLRQPAALSCLATTSSNHYRRGDSSRAMHVGCKYIGRCRRTCHSF